MKTKIISIYGIIFYIISYFGCSKDSEIPCGTITDISFSYSMLSTTIFLSLDGETE